MSSNVIYASRFYETLAKKSRPDILSQYIDLCTKYLTNKKSSLTEAHHVFPKSIFGENDVLVNLPIKEHFNAHVLLWKMIDYDIDYISYKKMANAVHKMVQGRPDHFTPEDYETARLAVVEARKNTSTAFDIREFKNVKVLTSMIDNKRYFNVFPMTYQGKKIWVSVMDPRWVECTAFECIKKYFDNETGEYVKLNTKFAKKNPERYVYWQKGRKPVILEKSRKVNMYDPISERLIRIDTEDGKKHGYLSCTNYIDTYNDLIVYLPPSIAKKQPDRYVNANAGKLDVYLNETGKLIKIKKQDFDSSIHTYKKDFIKS